MAVREILKMGDARLLRIAKPVQRFDTPDLHALIADMFDTMRAAEGAGLAAPQIGVDLAVTGAVRAVSDETTTVLGTTTQRTATQWDLSQTAQ